MTKAHAKSLGIDQQVWVYRNLVKALPWYSGVRALLNDTRYEGFFLRFDEAKKPFHVPQCDGAKCTELYHDQTQSPQSGAKCATMIKNCGCCVDGACDVGKQPCGEYLWSECDSQQPLFRSCMSGPDSRSLVAAHRPRQRHDATRLPRE